MLVRQAFYQLSYLRACMHTCVRAHSHTHAHSRTHAHTPFCRVDLLQPRLTLVPGLTSQVCSNVARFVHCLYKKLLAIRLDSTTSGKPREPVLDHSRPSALGRMLTVSLKCLNVKKRKGKEGE